MATAGDGVSSDQGGISAATGTIPEFEQLLEITRPEIKRVLPNDVLLHIFVRLLGKQLGQMRTLSKSWKDLLSHPLFVRSHLHHSFHNRNQQLLLVFEDVSLPFRQYSILSTHLEPTDFIKRIPTSHPMTIVGAVKGLICLCEDGYSDIRIWNPSLSSQSNIPQPQPDPKPKPLTSYYVKTSMRFGFDPESGDFKLVRLSGICSIHTGPTVQEWLPVQVYSTTRKSWATISQPCPSHITSAESYDALFVDGHDGHLHWEIVTSKPERTLLAFDLGAERFREMLCPESIPDYSHGHLGVLSGMLCEMVWLKDRKCEVWVMGQYGVSESWTKLHVFSQFTGHYASYGFSLRNEFLLADEEQRIVLYEPIQGKIKLTATPQLAYAMVEYQDSLFWV